MSYRPLNQQNRTKLSRQKNTPMQTLFLDDKVPPLVSINATKQKPNDKISIDSLNQSQVRSIYTVDKQELDRHTLDILNKSFKSQKNQRLFIKPVSVENVMGIKNFQTPILAKDFDFSVKEQEKTPIVHLQQFREYQYQNCHAIKLYKNLVQNPLKQNNRRQDHFQFQWFSSKHPAQLLANVLTNASRLRLYIHYLLIQIHKNDQAMYINQIHQQKLYNFNSNLKEVYSNIICLLLKLVKRPIQNDGKSRSQNLLEVSIFQNGINIDIDPKCSQIKKRNNEKIRQLRHIATQQQTNLHQTKKLYEQIIQNYAMTIENLNNNNDFNQQLNTNSLHVPLKESRVHLQIEDDQIDVIRRKNHTFGMKQLSGRSSRQ